MAASSLSLHEREEIRAGIAREQTDRQIADRLGRHRCTINAEINRNGGRKHYSAVNAERRATRKRQRPRRSKIESDSELFDHIRWRLDLHDSPMTISIELARGTWGIVRSVCHETIYQAVYSDVFGKVRTPHLKRRRRKHRQQTNRGGHSLGAFRPIHERPAAANKRECVGHLEGDLIVGAYNQSALITLADRKTRACWIEPIASKKARDLTVSLTRLLDRLPPEAKKTLTWDQGAEIAQWQSIETLCGIDIYIADPKSPWQRPTNENLNAHIRRHVGKGTDLSKIPHSHLKAIETRLNTTPRRSLGWHTANDIYNQAVAITD